MRRIFRNSTALALALALPQMAGAETLSAAEAAELAETRNTNMPRLAEVLTAEIESGVKADDLTCLMNAPKPCPDGTPLFTPKGVAVQLVDDGSFILAPAAQQAKVVGPGGELIPNPNAPTYAAPPPSAEAPAAVEAPVVVADAAPVMVPSAPEDAAAPVVAADADDNDAAAADAHAAVAADAPSEAVANAEAEAQADAAAAEKAAQAAADAAAAAATTAAAAAAPVVTPADPARTEAQAAPADAPADAAASTPRAAQPSEADLARALEARAPAADAAPVVTPAAPAETATAPVVTPAPAADAAQTADAARAAVADATTETTTPAVVTPAPTTPPVRTAAQVAEDDALTAALAEAKAIPEEGVAETEAAREAAAAAEAPAAAALAEAAAPVTTSETTTVTAETARDATEDFATNLRGELKDAGVPVVGPADGSAPAAAARSDSDLETALKDAVLPALAGMVVGQMLSNNREVALNSGDRVVVQRADGSQEVLKDDNALLLRPGSTVQTENYADGSQRTIVTREDGSQVVTIRDADLRVLRRTLVNTDGTTVALIDETAAVQPVDVASLPRPADPVVVTPSAPLTDEELRAALRRETDVGRTFTLGQIRNIPEVRALVAPVDIQAITFDTGSAAIKPDQAQALAALGRVIADQVRQNPAEMFLIEGHTDTVGADAMNLALSDRRAESVALALTEFFRVPPENMVVQGYGERFLKIPREGDIRVNRRAAVRRITDLMARN